MLISSRHDRHIIRRRQRILAGVLFLALCLLVFRTSAENVLSGIFHRIASPIWLLGSYVGDRLKEDQYYFSSKEALYRENILLKETLDLVALEAYSREELRSENTALKEMLGRPQGRALLLARVLATPGNSPYDTLIIDVGTRDGIIPGMKVMSDGDFELGVVSEVYYGSAVATLYSSYGNELPVTIGASSTPAMLYGEGGGGFRAILPKGVSVNEGDLVRIPAIAPTYAGVIRTVSRPEGSSLQAVFLRWPMNINTIRYVYVVTGERESKKP